MYVWIILETKTHNQYVLANDVWLVKYASTEKTFNGYGKKMCNLYVYKIGKLTF